jgi:hypothetical protein
MPSWVGPSLPTRLSSSHRGPPLSPPRHRRRPGLLTASSFLPSRPPSSSRWLPPSLEPVCGSRPPSPPDADPAGQAGTTIGSDLDHHAHRSPPPLRRHRLAGGIVSGRPRQVPPPRSLSLSPSYYFGPKVAVAGGGGSVNDGEKGAEESKAWHGPSSSP